MTHYRNVHKNNTILYHNRNVILGLPALPRKSPATIFGRIKKNGDEIKKIRQWLHGGISYTNCHGDKKFENQPFHNVDMKHKGL